MRKNFASILISSDYYKTFDAIISVPFIPKGRNNADITRAIGLHWDLTKFIRLKMNPQFFTGLSKTQTQTKKSRFERWQNVDSIFKIKNTLTLKDKHVLLVDDVLTTEQHSKHVQRLCLKRKILQFQLSLLQLQVNDLFSRVLICNSFKQITIFFSAIHLHRNFITAMEKYILHQGERMKNILKC